MDLRRGLGATRATGVLAYRKNSPGDSCLVVLNAGEDPQTVRLPAQTATHIDVLTGARFTTADGHIDVPVDAWSAAILAHDSSNGRGTS